MLINHHVCPRVRPHWGTMFPPAFYAYDSLQAEAYGSDTHLSYWNSAVDGLQLGFQWTASQSEALNQYPVYKTYEIIPYMGMGSWIAVQRVGYLLPEGFLPIWIAYRDNTATRRYVMPRNVGYLYNDLLKVNTPVCTGIAPALKFILDISSTNPLDGKSQINYLTAQKLATQAFKDGGALLALDIRSTLRAGDHIRALSEAIDGLGNRTTMTQVKMYAWLCENLLTYPPVKDWLLDAYPNQPIPIGVLHRLTGPGPFDDIPALPLNYPPTTEKLPDALVEDILSLQSTDLLLTFAIHDNQLYHTPTHCFSQNRFGAYIQTDLAADIKVVFNILQKLWVNGLYAYGSVAPTPATQARFELTANEEVKISFGNEGFPDRYRVYYANLANVFEMGCSVAQTPLFTKKY